MKIKEIRESKHITQRKAAIDLGLSPVVYGRYENGQRQPSPETLALIAEYYGVTVDELLGRITEKEALAMQGLQLDEKRVITEYRRLSDEGKTMLFQYLLFLRSQYPKEPAEPSAT